MNHFHLNNLRIKLAQKFFQIAYKLVQCGAFTVGCVIYLIYSILIIGGHSQHIHLNHIVYMSEIAAVFTITINNRTFMSHQFLHKQWNHSGVCAKRILTTPEHIEIAQSDAFHTVCFGKHIGIEFVHILGNGIRR